MIIKSMTKILKRSLIHNILTLLFFEGHTRKKRWFLFYNVSPPPLHESHFRGENRSGSIAPVPRAARGGEAPSLPQIALLSVAYLRLLGYCPFGTHFYLNRFNCDHRCGLVEACFQ